MREYEQLKLFLKSNYNNLINKSDDYLSNLNRHIYYKYGKTIKTIIDEE